MIITIPTSIFNAVAIAIGDDGIRYYLSGIFFDRRGCLVATNGHILAVGKIDWPVEDECKFGEIIGDSRGIIISKSTITGFQKAIKPMKPESIELRHANGEWSLAADSVSMTFIPVDREYPEWDRIIPEATPKELVPAHYDPKYIKALADMSAQLSGIRDNYFINQNGHNAAIVQFHGREDYITVLMPKRNNAPWEFNRDQFISPLID